MNFKLAFVYVGAILCANWSAATFGPAITPVNAFLFIGLDLALRNWLGASYTRLQMLTLILVGGAASYAININAGPIAVASTVAFFVSALIDWSVFKIAKGTWLARSMGGVTAGAAADSIIFPTIAFGGFMLNIVALQFAAKVAGGFVWSLLIKKVAR